MNKLKLSIIAIATIVASNTNAQTFYQCVPNGCPNGQYFDGATCKSLPTQGLPCIYILSSRSNNTLYFIKELSSSKGAKLYCVKVNGMDSITFCSIILTDGDSITYSYDRDSYIYETSGFSYERTRITTDEMIQLRGYLSGYVKTVTCNNGKLEGKEFYSF